MAEQINDLEPLTSSAPITDQGEVTSNAVRLPKIILQRIDEQTILNFQTRTPKKSHKRVTSVNAKVQKVLNKSPRKDNRTDVKRPRGRPKKISVESPSLNVKKNNTKLGVKNKTRTSIQKSSILKKNNLKLGVKNKTDSKTTNSKIIRNKKPSKEFVKLQSKPGGLLKKTMLQKKSKVPIPPVKKSKVSPNKVIKPKSLAEAKPSPPKPKLEVMPSKIGAYSSDTSGDEFLYDELIEELENTANKRIVDAKPVSEKTTITLKPNAGNKPPIVLKGGIVKKTDLPSDLNLFAPSNKSPSNVMTNGIQKIKQTAVLTPSWKRKNSDILGQAGSAKKPSPWPVSLVPSPKKSPVTSVNSQKKKGLTTKVGVAQLSVKPTKITSPNTEYSSFTSSEVLPESSNQPKSVTPGMVKPKIGPKQTAKVGPLSNSVDADDYLSDEYLEEETLECDFEVDQLPKASQIKSNTIQSHVSTVRPSEDRNGSQDLLKILTDDSEESTKAKSNEVKGKRIGPSVDIPKNINEEEVTIVPLDVTSEQTEDTENEEGPVRTMYDVMNEVFLEYPSWNLHLIPETSAFCIAQVTKGRLGLPTLKKCIELDPVSYNAKVYIHQYHIKRFDGVYDGEESILALIKEIDSIKA